MLNLPRRPIVQFISLSTRSSFSRQPAWSAPHAASLALSSFAVRARSRPLASSTSPPAADAPTPADGPPSCAGAPPPPPEARRRGAQVSQPLRDVPDDLQVVVRLLESSHRCLDERVRKALREMLFSLWLLK